MENLKTRYQNIIIIALIIGLALFFNANRLNQFPSYIHAWAQADWYSISLGFLDNGFDFFHPQTFVLNKQFPDNFRFPYENGITSVDFPIHSYMVAVIMKIFGTNSPWCYRVYTLIYCIIGLFFLYKTFRLFKCNFQTSLFLIVFAATSPVFFYYQAGFLPGIPSLCNAIIGMYLYIRYLKFNNKKLFYLAILFLTLATLSRTTFLLAFSSVMGLEILIFLNNRKLQWFKILGFLAGLFFIAIYYAYNQHLRTVYGSIFLNYLTPPENFANAWDTIGKSVNNWFFHYYTLFHYLAFVFMLIFFVVYASKHKIRAFFMDKVLALIAIYFLACIAFFIVMMKQFILHDYYFIDTFYLPCILFSAFLFSKIHLELSKFRYFYKLLMLFALLFIIAAKTMDKKRQETGYWDRNAYCLKNFSTAPDFFDEIGIEKQAKIMVVDAKSPNIPFILMNRKGYNSMECTEDFFKYSYSWDFDYLVAQTEFLISDIYKKYPAFIQNFQKIAENGYLSVFRKLKSPIDCNVEHFLGIDSSKSLLIDSINFDQSFSQLWKNYDKHAGLKIAGDSCGYMSSDKEFGLTWNFQNFQHFNRNKTVLKFSGQFLLPDKKLLGCNLVVSVSVNSKFVYYQIIDIAEDIVQIDSLLTKDYYFIIPKIMDKNTELSLYFWNLGKNKFLYDNIYLKIY